MVKRFILILIILLFCCSSAYAQYEHVFFTGDHFGVRWDAGANALGYEWHAKRISDSVIIREGQTSLLQVSFFISSAGTYVFYIRAWNFEDDGITKRYSIWATSLTHGRVNGQTQPWQIKIKLKPVGPLMFDLDGP